MNTLSISRIFFNPVIGAILFLAPSFLFFTESTNWWIYQTALQCMVCIFGLMIPQWRLGAFVLLLGTLLLTAGWFIRSPAIPASCVDQIDSVVGVTTTDSFQTSHSIQLIRVELNCKRDRVRFPVAEVNLSNRPPKKLNWFLVGDQLSLKNVKLERSTAFSLAFTPDKRFYAFNKSRQKRRLNRGSLFYYIQDKADYYLTPTISALFKAVITSDRSSLTTNCKNMFRRLGITHLFAISGLHVGLIYMWLYLVARILISPFIRNLASGRYLFIIDLVCLFLIYQFLVVIGMPISAKRAFIMLAWIVSLKWVFSWQPLWFVLIGTACMILLFTPVAIGQLSFQLSFLSVAGIIYILPLLPSKKQIGNAVSDIAIVLVNSFIVSAWLFLLNFPLVNKIFPSFSILTASNNMVHVLIFSLLVLPIMLLLLGTIVASYPFWGFPYEWWIFNLVNIVGKGWEWLLVKTNRINDILLFTLTIEWNVRSYAAYWSTLLFLSFLIRKRILIYKNKQMFSFSLDRASSI